MELTVIREYCIGGGMCALTAPELFDQDAEEGKVVVLAEAATAEQREALVRAVEACPSGAIRLAGQGD
ncbi:ferredoxin [Nocardia mexicana]|uniref:Ferredoxin n=1 Tax=Nocardia mexicana TaxID=279262 RepID=A0A370H8C1_9NOCA|nr:ferredoxin [Nocardia mexicana]RDI52915.1 ferredoxin [Nocardia mexicana]